jgi:anaerobic ribonucleoside-triphosphate reductase activating protein
MQIVRIYYPVQTLGPGKRIGIWTVGCPHHCYRCSNPELWEPDPAREVPLASIEETLVYMKKEKHRIDGVTISGGEPFLQPEGLSEMVKFLKAYVSEDILVYTGYTIEMLQSVGDPFIAAVLGNISVLVDGPYVDDLNDNLGLRGSSNQRVLVLNTKYKIRYKTAMTQKRVVQNVHYDSGVISFGIPLKNYKSNLSNKLRARGVHYE